MFFRVGTFSLFFFSFFSRLCFPFLSATWLRSYTLPPKSTMCRSAWSPPPIGSWRLVLSRRAMGHTNCQKLRSRDRGFLAHSFHLNLRILCWYTPLSFFFRFFLYREMEGGLEGFIFSIYVAYVSNDLDFFIGLPSPDVNVRAYLSLWRSYLELQ